MAANVTFSPTVSATIHANGRILIPAALRKQMGLNAGDSVLMDVEDGVLRIESHRARIRRIQQEFAPYAKPGVLASDELIAERREEARREEARREEEELARDCEQYQTHVLKAEQVA